MSAASPASNRRSTDATLPVVDTPAGLRQRTRAWRAAGERIALVPTMGDLHAGHLALVDQARRDADRVVASVFVNPLQFGPGEDYESYPRVLEADLEKLAAHGADMLYAPAVETVYPRGTADTVRVRVPGLEDVLCGAARPGHFAGVATVVAKLLNAADPDLALFGEKDYQQLLIIRRLVQDLDFAVEVMGVATVREPDGLALSSRNGYLTSKERASAPALHGALKGVAARVWAGEQDFSCMEEDAMEELEAAGFRPEYVAIRRQADLGPPRPGDDPGTLRVFAAARLGAARLIDNVAVDAETP